MRVFCTTFTPDSQNLITRSIDCIREFWNPCKYSVMKWHRLFNDQFMMHNLSANNETTC